VMDHLIWKVSSERVTDGEDLRVGDKLRLDLTREAIYAITSGESMKDSIMDVTVVEVDSKGKTAYVENPRGVRFRLGFKLVVMTKPPPKPMKFQVNKVERLSKGS
jgi:hypothetical protein